MKEHETKGSMISLPMSVSGDCWDTARETEKKTGAAESEKCIHMADVITKTQDMREEMVAVRAEESRNIYQPATCS